MVAAQTPAGQSGGAPQAGGGQPGPAPKPLIMTITAFADGSDIPVKYTQAGDQTSPAITWKHPAGTMSFLLHMHDMEGSRNRTTEDQLHWLVWNIPAPQRTSERYLDGSSVAERSLSNQRERAGLSRPWRSCHWPATPLHFRTFCFGHEGRCPAWHGRIRDSHKRNESDTGAHPGKAVYMGLFHRPQ